MKFVIMDLDDLSLVIEEWHRERKDNRFSDRILIYLP